ncbi:GNAT family N-acetyltransferase [Tenggerimyces flavus]|uniref:GNAT family N-acetyltransferase n=1 Tax=Tenggerimyces flavus TaxID=1708749 RepID=A0ABV7YLJ9_9ACTN|nr:GNAT family N-acetyltransferase [Tenggerimyces flavus]MBM7789482.1 putative acetyltransferase [Tenggerimyces flavus]
MPTHSKIEIRPSGDDWDQIVHLVELAFAQPYPEQERELDRSAFEPDRSIGAYAGSELVGHATTYFRPMAVPGDVNLWTELLTLVAVRPTHRRRGVLSSLMRDQLTGIHEVGGSPVIALTASEPAIYGRFGYGLASEHAQVEINRTDRALRPVADVENVRIEYASLEESLATCSAIREATRAERPGMFHHDDAWQRKLIADPPELREGAGELRCVLADVDGTVGGYAYFRASGPWGDRRIEVMRLHATDLLSYVALWRFLLDQDLVARTTWGRAALDEPLVSLLIDPRAAKKRIWDGHWVRLIDVDRALAARRYASPIDVVLEVADPFCPWNAGRWRLAGDATGATCERTTAPAELALDVRELGAAYLGRPSLAAAGLAGLVVEQKAGALAVASRAFVSEPLPICDTGY